MRRHCHPRIGLVQPFAQHRMAGVRFAEVFLEVLPGGERIARAGDDDDLAGVVHLERVEGLVHFAHDGRVDRVSFFRPVERHPRDAVLDLHDDAFLNLPSCLGRLPGAVHLKLLPDLNIRNP